MSHLPIARRAIAAAVSAALLVSACATNPDGSIKVDDKAKGALIGAVAGCALASAAGKSCAAGAVVGAAAGFLIGWYFESKKLADAQQVNKEYERKGAVVPKKDITPVAFDTRVTPSQPDSSGQKEVQITSNTDLIGYGDKVPDVQQKYVILDEKNQVVEEKTEKVAAVDGAGRYQTNSKFKLPADAKGKRYTVKTTQVVNGKEGKTSAYKVAFLDDQHIQIAMAY